MQINDEVYKKADELLFHISLSADSLMFIGYGLMQQSEINSEDGMLSST